MNQQNSAQINALEVLKNPPIDPYLLLTSIRAKQSQKTEPQFRLKLPIR
ncbi:hypothetical protein SynA1562_01755 [Synechococcus sp. A15-62]|nr:hypothetical protein SynA1562_01755 [Synechococcus sp. A15-62]